MKMYLCRHGETTGDVEGVYGGDYDDNLTEKGREQSRRLAEKLMERGIEAIYHSPEARAAETAKITADKLKVPAFAMENLRERNNYGVLAGMKKAEAPEKFPGEVKKLESGSESHGVSGSEEYAEFKERVMRTFNAIMNEQEGAFAVITHAGPIKLLLKELAEEKIASVGDCAVAELEKTGEHYRVISLDGMEKAE